MTHKLELNKGPKIPFGNSAWGKMQENLHGGLLEHAPLYH